MRGTTKSEEGGRCTGKRGINRQEWPPFWGKFTSLLEKAVYSIGQPKLPAHGIAQSSNFSIIPNLTLSELLTSIS